MNRVELQGLRASRLVKARLLQWRLLSRRRPPAQWFGGAGSSSSSGDSEEPYLDNEYEQPGRGGRGPTSKSRGSSVATAVAAITAATEAFGGGCCHHRQRPAFPLASSQLGAMADSCPEILEQIFHFVRSRELRAVTLLGRAFKYQLDCQEIWRQLYFLRFSTVFGKFKSWKILYIQRDERCDRIKSWRAFFERSRQQQQQLQAAA